MKYVTKLCLLYLDKNVTWTILTLGQKRHLDNVHLENNVAWTMFTRTICTWTIVHLDNLHFDKNQKDPFKSSSLVRTKIGLSF